MVRVLASAYTNTVVPGNVLETTYSRKTLKTGLAVDAAVDCAVPGTEYWSINFQVLCSTLYWIWCLDD